MNNNNLYLQSILSRKWQGVILKSMLEDESRLKESLYWLSDCKSCPTSTISELMPLLYQTLNTKCYKKHLNTGEVTDTVCRLCKNSQESVKHLLSNCSDLMKKVYKVRHDNAAFKCFFFEVLARFELIEDAPSLNITMNTIQFLGIFQNTLAETTKPYMTLRVLMGR